VPTNHFSGLEWARGPYEQSFKPAAEFRRYG